MLARQKTKRTVKQKHPKEARAPRLRVLIASALPVTLAGLQSLLSAHREFEIIVTSGNDAQLSDVLTAGDVLLIDADEYAAANGDFLEAVTPWSRVIPVVAMVANPSAGWLARALHAGVRGLLPPAMSGEDLASALRASAAGLVVLGQEFSDMIFAQSRHSEDDELEATEALTPREQEVLAMIAEGLLNKEIADRLQVSEHTVKFHVSSIMGKLGASSRTEAVTRGIRRGLVLI